MMHVCFCGNITLVVDHALCKFALEIIELYETMLFRL